MMFDTKGPKNQRILTYITIILVIVVGTVSSFLKNSQEETGYLTFHNEGYLTIKDASGASADVYYKDMTSIQYVEAPDFGEANGGGVVDDIRLGQWNSEQFGVYMNCTEVDLKTCIFIETENGSYAISYESEATTEALCKAIVEARGKIIS